MHAKNLLKDHARGCGSPSPKVILMTQVTMDVFMDDHKHGHAVTIQTKLEANLGFMVFRL